MAFGDGTCPLGGLGGFEGGRRGEASWGGDGGPQTGSEAREFRASPISGFCRGSSARLHRPLGLWEPGVRVPEGAARPARRSA